MDDSCGIIMFNKNTKCLVRAIVALKTLRDHYNGPITFFLEKTPKEFEDVCRHYNCDVVWNDTRDDIKTLVRKTEMFLYSPYDRTLWLDSDLVVLGPIDEMFEYLDHYSIAIPHFAGWVSNGSRIQKRIRQYEGIADQKYIDKAVQEYPAINTGVLSFRKTDPFLKTWFDLALKGDFFIQDEIAFQVLYPSYHDIVPDGDGVFIAPMKFNASIKHDKGTEDIRILHAHGQKHCIDLPLCRVWKDIFNEMCEKNEANINYFIQYADKRLKKYLEQDESSADKKDVTVVTACDEKYVDILRETYPNWRKYKNIDDFPVIVFVNGIPLDDGRLDFLRLPNVKLIDWSMDNVDDHREEMLSAFVFGTAENVKTDYWLKLDADSFATDYSPLYDESYKEYAFCGHRWGYSRPNHIRQLDEWAKNHWRSKLKKAPPMIEEGRIEGNRFYHNKKRTISFIQLHKTKFTRFCVKLCKDKRLPAPTQDTFMFYVCDRFDPQFIGVANFKKKHGFTQGNGRKGVEKIKEALMEVDSRHSQDDTGDARETSSEENIHDAHKQKRGPVMVDPNSENVVVEIVEVNKNNG